MIHDLTLQQDIAQHQSSMHVPDGSTRGDKVVDGMRSGDVLHQLRRSLVFNSDTASTPSLQMHQKIDGAAIGLVLHGVAHS